MVPADSRKVSPASRYSGYPPRSHHYTYRPFTSYGAAFQAASISDDRNYAGPTTPGPVGPGLGCSPFARHYLGNHYCFLFLWVLRCFSSPGMPPTLRWALSGCPIRKSTDLSSFAAPRSLSQLYTSFIASACQGIHRVPLSALFIELARPVCCQTARAQLQGYSCGLNVGRTAFRYLWR